MSILWYDSFEITIKGNNRVTSSKTISKCLDDRRVIIRYTLLWIYCFNFYIILPLENWKGVEMIDREEEYSSEYWSWWKLKLYWSSDNRTSNDFRTYSYFNGMNRTFLYHSSRNMVMHIIWWIMVIYLMDMNWKKMIDRVK